MTVALRLAAALLLLATIADAQQCIEGTDCNDMGFPTCTVRPCVGGVCQPPRPRNCNDNDPCTVDSCHPSGFCLHDPLCPDNGRFCDGAEYCTIILVNFEPVAICAGDAPSCDDADACTVDFCDDPGGCMHAPKSCADGNVCTTDVCDHVLGCGNVAIAGCCRTSAECADACTPATCIQNACVASAPLTCDDGDACTTDACDAVVGCANTPIPDCCQTDDDCGDPCTSARRCVAGTCAETTVPTCDDGDPCTVERCAPGVGCVSDGRSGFDAVACLCERRLPSTCAAERIPKKITKGLAKACKLIGRAATAEAVKQKRLTSRAATHLGRARTKADASEGRVAEVCRAPLVALLGDDHQRAQVLAGGR